MSQVNNPNLVFNFRLHTIPYLKGVFKIGIVLSNLLTCITGLFIGQLVTKQYFEFELYDLLFLCCGLILIVSGSCAWNTILENDIDSYMERTKHRPTVTMSSNNIIVKRIANISIIIGLILLLLINIYVLFLGIAGVFIYIYIYTIILKRSSHYHTLIGSLSGIVPLLMGYTSITHTFTSEILLITSFLFIWQIPHFNFLAIVRSNDYLNAGIPTFVSKYGVKKTLIANRRLLIILLLISFKLISLSPLFTIFVSLAILYWIYFSTKISYLKNNITDAKRGFRISIIVLMIGCFSIFFETLIKSI